MQAVVPPRAFAAATVIAMVASRPVVTRVASAATAVAFGIVVPLTPVAVAYVCAARAFGFAVSAIVIVLVAPAFVAVPAASAFVSAAFAFVPVESAFVVVSVTSESASAAFASASGVVTVLVEFGVARPAC